MINMMQHEEMLKQNVNSMVNQHYNEVQDLTDKLMTLSNTINKECDWNSLPSEVKDIVTQFKTEAI